MAQSDRLPLKLEACYAFRQLLKPHDFFSILRISRHGEPDQIPALLEKVCQMMQKKEVAYFDDSIVVTVYPVVEIANFSEWVVRIKSS